MSIKVFISSVQKEFAEERAALRDFLHGDALLRRFFEPFLFEDVPAADRRTDEVYRDEVRGCGVYIGLFGNDYGFEDAEGFSPTQREFDLATSQHKQRRCLKAGLNEPDFEMRDGFVLTLWRQAAIWPELRPESLEIRVLGLLRAGACSKREISLGLGHKEVSGQLNKVIRL